MKAASVLQTRREQHRTRSMGGTLQVGAAAAGVGAAATGVGAAAAGAGTPSKASAGRAFHRNFRGRSGH